MPMHFKVWSGSDDYDDGDDIGEDDNAEYLTFIKSSLSHFTHVF